MITNIRLMRRGARTGAAELLGAILGTVAASAPLWAQTAVRPNLEAVSTNGQLQLLLAGQSNRVYQIEASTDLINWKAIAQQAGGYGTVAQPDARAPHFPWRFYRAVSPDDFTNLGGGPYSTDRILVKPLAGMDLSLLHSALGLQVLRVFPAIGGLQVVKVPPNLTVSEALASYKDSGQVEYAEPDLRLHALATPNDPYYQKGNLWALHNVGQSGGTTNADIDAPDAWDVQHDATNIVVAIVDTGVRYTHEDLASNIWINPVDGSHGTNFVAGNTDPYDDDGHGTHLAGIIGAVGNNAVGIVGVAWHVQIMACKFLDSSGTGSLEGAIACLDYARSHGANILNASWGWTGAPSEALHDAIASLRDAGILFVAAAGNNGHNNDVTLEYPASYSDLDNVVAVAATDRNDQLTSWSNYGATNVDLGAPGAAILSCWNGSDSDYQYADGTSMAAPMVAGVLAVMEAHLPNADYLNVKQQVLANVDPLPTLQGKCLTGGRLNLYRALSGNSPPPSSVTASFSANPSSGPAPLTVQFTDQSTGPVVSWYWTSGDGATTTVQSPTYTYTNAGNFTATLTVSGSDGQTNSTSQAITVSSPPAPVTASFSANPSSGRAPLIVQFTDHSTGPVVSWYWTSGDGATSTVQNPTYTYTNAGNFTATLTVTGSGGQTNSTSQTIAVSSPPAPVTASFSANPSSGPAPLTVLFTDHSSGPVVGWNWNFGDGATSTVQNPSHTYSGPGTFSVTLTVSGSDGQTSSTSLSISVTSPPPPPPTSTVKVTALQSLATSLTPGVFTVSRSGDTSSALAISYSLGGSAQNGVDYQSLSGTVVISSNSTTASVVVRPQGTITLLKTVVLTLSPGGGYTIGSPGWATVTIVVSVGL